MGEILGEEYTIMLYVGLCNVVCFEFSVEMRKSLI